MYAKTTPNTIQMKGINKTDGYQLLDRGYSLNPLSDDFRIKTSTQECQKMKENLQILAQHTNALPASEHIPTNGAQIATMALAVPTFPAVSRCMESRTPHGLEIDNKENKCSGHRFICGEQHYRHTL
jgi:hypothetical protein